MKNKKILWLVLAVQILCFSVILSAFALPAFAADTDTLTFTLEAVSSKVNDDDRPVINAGDSFIVNVKVESNPGLLYACAEVVYDTTTIQYDGFELTDSVFNEHDEIDVDSTTAPGKVFVTIGNISYTVLPETGDPYTETGLVVALKFTMLDGADGALNISLNLPDGAVADTNGKPADRPGSNVEVSRPADAAPGSTVSSNVEIQRVDTATHTHTNVNVAEKAPGCENNGHEAGVRCSVCGTVESGLAVIPATGHSITHVDYKAPTCTEIGWEAYDKCDNGCGYTTYVEIPETGHHYTLVNQYDETNHWTQCRDCDEKIDVEAHTFVGGVCSCGYGCTHTVGTPATCTEQAICGICGNSYGELAPHTVVAIGAAVDPGCGTAGITAGEKCSACEKLITPRQLIPATGLHDTANAVAVSEAKEATCVSAGMTAGKKCPDCGEILEAPEVIPAKGHPSDKLETIPAVAPTCTVDGLTAGIRCTECGFIVLEQQVDPAAGHQTKGVLAAVAETCTTTGLTAGEYCKDCNMILVAQEVISATGHQNKGVLAAVDATCTTTGLTAGEYCKDCNMILVAQEVIPATGHPTDKLVVIPAVAPTCTADGLKAGEYCSVCDMITKKQEVDPKTGHTEAEIPAVAPTCTVAGSTAGKACSVCNTVLTAPEAVAATGHTEVVDAAVAPTCTATGLSEGKHCSVCMTITTAQTVVAATGHTEAEIPAVAPTCTVAGSTAGKECSVCNTVLTAPEAVAATGHTAEEYQHKGEKCSVCNELLVEPVSLTWLWVLISVVATAGALVAVYFFLLKKKLI